MTSLFQLPHELLLSSLCVRFPCRDQQIRSLAALLSVSICQLHLHPLSDLLNISNSYLANYSVYRYDQHRVEILFSMDLKLRAKAP